MRRLLILATGGTIAGTAARADQTVGYRAGALPIAALLASVPALGDIARITAEQPFAKGSEDMTSADWLVLARRIRAAGQADEADAIVVTHGTDTMEETAWFLDLVCAASPPVVMTGAMRPATATGADGPANLAFACRAALADRPPPTGLRVAFAGRLHPADAVAKVHTLALDAFADRDPAGPDSPAAGSSGRFAGVPLPDALPTVALVTAHVDADPAIIDHHLERGARGIVIAGTGHGTLAGPMRDALVRARSGGCRIVRASRVPAGPVLRNAEADPARHDDALGFLVAGRLGPLKARILLQCATMAGWPDEAVAAEFARYEVRI